MKRLTFLTFGVCLLFAVGAFAETAGVVSATDGVDAQRAYIEEAFKDALVFPGATVEDFLYPEPEDGQVLLGPAYPAWVEVFDFPINESPYAVGVVYNKNAIADERYAVTTGIFPGPMMRFYDEGGNQTRTCNLPNASSWGITDMDLDIGRDEFHGGGIGVANRRRVFIDNCRTVCERSVPGLANHLTTAHHDGGSDPDTVWGTYWSTDFRCYSISMPTCAYTDEGYLMSNAGRGDNLGLAIDMDGCIGEPWVLWCAYQTGPGGNRLEARKRDGSVIGTQSLPGIAGGLHYTDNWATTGKPALVYMEQGSPDRVHVYQPESCAGGGLVVDVDIKPQSCPNPLNVKSRGVLPVAILGTEDFDVTEIDPASVRLLEVVSPLRWAVEDVSTPVVDPQEECECTEEGPDGFVDLTLKFDKQEVVDALGEGIEDGDVIPLNLTGNLKEEFGGTAIEGQDCVVIIKKKRGKQFAGSVSSSPVFALSQNNPNPFARETSISYILPSSGHTTLKIYDTSGRLVETLVDSEMSAGVYSTTWDRKDAASGIYFYRLTSGGNSLTKTMTVLR